jgi:hypothetical protein
VAITIVKVSDAGRSWGSPGNNQFWSGRYVVMVDGVKRAVIYNRARKAYEPADWRVDEYDVNGVPRPWGFSSFNTLREAKAACMKEYSK